MSVEQLPPHDLKAEGATISALIYAPAQIPRVASMLRREDFCSAAYGWIYEAIVSLHRAGSPADAVTVISWLRDRNKLQMLGPGGFAGVLNEAPAAENGIKYARIVLRKSRVRATIAAAQRIAAEGYAGGVDDAEYLARSTLAMMAAARLPEAEALTGNAEALADIVRGIQRAGATGSMVTGIPTGLDRYDLLTLGLHARQLTVIAARPGMGKTSLGATIATNVAMTGIGVLFFSLEMSRQEIVSRQLSALSGVDGMIMKRGCLTQTQWGKLTTACETLNKLPCWIDDRTGLTVRDIANTALGAIDESKSRGSALGCIVVDYLQKIAVPEGDRRKQRYQQVGDIAAGLKQLARDASLPVITMAQLRRAKAGEKGRPTMDDLRESGDIEQEADNITLLHAPDDEKKLRDLIIEKARGGRTGLVHVGWRPELTWFENLPDETSNPRHWTDEAAQ